MAEQAGFFDEELRLRKLSELGDSLEKLNCIDWESFRPIIKSVFKKKGASNAGRPAFDYVMMFKILVLQRFYNLSDDKTEFMINDRMSFMRFLGLTLTDKVPDAKTIWNFREQLTNSGRMRNLFNKFEKKLEKDGIIAHEATLIDATFVEAPRQRNSREENKKIKEGEVPENWKPNEEDSEADKLKKKHKIARKDVDARWTIKNRERIYGYKNHAKVDSKSKLVKNYKTTAANVHDSNVCGELLDENDKILCVDSGYMGRSVEKGIPFHVEFCCCKHSSRNRKLTREEEFINHTISKVRIRIEHVFGFMTNSMNGLTVRSVGIKRADTNIGLTNLVYNMFRYSCLLNQKKA